VRTTLELKQKRIQVKASKKSRAPFQLAVQFKKWQFYSRFILEQKVAWPRANLKKGLTTARKLKLGIRASTCDFRCKLCQHIHGSILMILA
jgi:hypothetical protein